MPAAQSLIASANFPPDKINKLWGIFQDAWSGVALRPGDHPETLRAVLAEAILDLAMSGQCDPTKLKELALLRLRKYMGL